MISSFEVINVVVPEPKILGLSDSDPKIFFRTQASVFDAVVVNPSGIKTLLATGLSTFLINGKSVFKNGPRSLPINLFVCIIWNSWVFYNLVLADKLFAKAL